MLRKYVVASTEGFFLFFCACICPRDKQESKFGLISKSLMFIQREIRGSSICFLVLESFLLKGTWALRSGPGLAVVARPHWSVGCNVECCQWECPILPLPHRCPSWPSSRQAEGWSQWQGCTAASWGSRSWISWTVWPTSAGCPAPPGKPARAGGLLRVTLLQRVASQSKQDQAIFFKHHINKFLSNRPLNTSLIWCTLFL